ncbi:MAG: B12-binding domain-containing radical SAM protein [Lachnospiraceae bacterium]|nr:B12-binding domain-containing radical SAM protein [Lachnospiraceae bacterium]
MKYKVLLLNPIAFDETAFIRVGRCQTKTQPGIECWPPIDLALIGSSLKQLKDLSEIRLYDGQIRQKYQAMLENIAIYAPDIVILNCSTPTFHSDIKLAQQIKKLKTHSFIIFFGLHATARPIEILESSVVDCCIIGEPEDAIQSVVEKYIETKKPKFNEINNIAYLSKEGKIKESKITKENSRIFLSHKPDRSLINNNYYKLHYNNKPFTIIQTSRGCSNKCIYCTSPVYSSRYSTRSVDSVVQEIEECIEKHKIFNFMFLSDTFTTDRKWVEDFCNRLIQMGSNISWMSNSRIDKIDYPLAKIMKMAGCRIVSLGIESADDNILKKAGKNITNKQIKQAVTDLYRAKIQTIGYFMFGLPGESKESMKMSIEFSQSLPLDYAYFYNATPFPGTALYNLAEKKHWLITHDWRQYTHGEKPLLNYETLSAAEIGKAIRTAYRKFYYRPKRIIKQLLQIHSLKILSNNIKAAIKLLRK